MAECKGDIQNVALVEAIIEFTMTRAQELKMCPLCANAALLAAAHTATDITKKMIKTPEGLADLNAAHDGDVARWIATKGKMK
jgi:hypothetical protein